MPSADYEIVPATHADIAGILALQEENLVERNGSLLVRFPHEYWEAALADMPVIVARRSGRVIGYLVSSSFAGQSHVPVIAATLKAYSGAPNAYLYGPVCVAASERGRGLAAELFVALRKQLKGREAVTFIRGDNAASLRAHEKMGMQEVARFTQNDLEIVVIRHPG